MHSMTAFAEVTQQHQSGVMSWTLKAINQRYLEIAFKLPPEAYNLENSLRNLAKQHLRRGKVDCILQYLMHPTQAEQPSIQLNKPLISEIALAAEQLHKIIPNCTPLSCMEIFNWPNVIHVTNIDLNSLQLAIKNSFSQALTKLIAMRQQEGKELQLLIQQRLLAIQQHLANIKQHYPTAIDHQRTKLLNKIAKLQVTQDAERIEQEVVLLINKFDNSEEIERLEVHINAIQNICNQDNCIGRKLDFIMQEMHRETNTIAAKSVDSFISATAIELKVLIEQIREQVQNIE